MENTKADHAKEIIALFTAVTGIEMYTQTADAFPEFNQNATDDSPICLLFSTEGSCRLTLHHASLYYTSPPIVCTPYAENAIYLRPGRLNHILRLLYALFAPNTKTVFRKYAFALSQSVLNKSPATAANLINRFPAETLTENGNNFFKNKQDFFCFALMLVELSEEAGFLCEIPCDVSNIARADSLGELISQFNEIKDCFMSSCFPALWIKHSQIIETVCGLMRSRYSEHITQSEIARAVFVSPSYLSKLFKEALGCSFNQYLNQIRIQKAISLLELPLTEPETVFSAVGYENRSYYGKMFRKLTGETPIGYRNRILGKE